MRLFAHSPTKYCVTLHVCVQGFFASLNARNFILTAITCLENGLWDSVDSSRGNSTMSNSLSVGTCPCPLFIFAVRVTEIVSSDIAGEYIYTFGILGMSEMLLSLNF